MRADASSGGHAGMGDVVKVEFTARDGLISSLERLVEKAKAGGVRGFTLLVFDEGGVLESGWAGDLSLAEIVGGLEVLKMEVMRREAVDD